MSIIKDTFFGGAEKDAARAQQAGIEKGIAATERATREAKADLNRLFPQAKSDLQQGFQGALDVFGQSLPAQVQAFQGGNIGAQEQLLAGLPLFQNAILGGNVDFSQLQPTQVQTPSLGFFQQQLPVVTSPQQDTAAINAPTPRFQQFSGAPTGSVNPVTMNPNTDFRAFDPDFIPRGPGDTPEQQLPNNLFALGGF